jgi:hypothetical protein
MMEARPAAALIMPEADLLLEILIVALHAPAHLGESTRRRSDMFGSPVVSQ